MKIYDVAIIGAGAVGCAIASALVRQGLSVALIEAASDVGAGTSKANTAIWHTGFDSKPHTWESRLVARGHQLLEAGSETFGWPLRRTGAVLVAWNGEQQARLDDISANAHSVGYTRTQPLTATQVYAAEPHLGAGVHAGLLIPDEGLLDPWSIVVALATDVRVNGGDLYLSAPVSTIATDPLGHHVISTPGRAITSRWLVNAAGLGSDHIDRAVGHDGFTITPRRGQLIVYDKAARPLLHHIVLPVPTSTTKGVLVSPTIFGNVLLGPTAEDLDDRTATQTTADGIAFLLDHGRRLMPSLMDYEVTATYAGLRAATEHSDYCYGVFGTYVRAAGIRSTGISSCLAIAEQVVADMREAGVEMRPLAHPRLVRVPDLAEDSRRPYADADLIATDSAYGDIVCLCERVSWGEIRDALASPVPPADADGLRRRTRALNGRCQGFHCGARVTAALGGGHE